MTSPPPTLATELLNEIVGVQVVERVSEEADAESPQTLGIDYLPMALRGLRSDRLSEEEGFASRLPSLVLRPPEGTHGWIDEPDLPLGAWIRPTEGHLVLFTLHVPALQAAYRPVLRKELPAFERAAGGIHRHDRWTAPDGVPIGGMQLHPGLEDRLPDSSLALRGRFGTWVLESWNPRHLTPVFNTRTFALASAGALAMAALGIALYRAQSLAQKRATERVSFVNRVSHELRTPVTNIQLNLELAEEALPPGSNTTATRLNLVKQESSRLSRLIDNVLTFSRVDRRNLRLQIREEDLIPILRNQIDAFEPAFSRRGIDIHCDLPSSLPAPVDADAFRQIVTNLLSNVEKYAPQGAATIEAGSAKGTPRLEISDHGPGIAAADRERIFQAFERVNDSVTEGSTGAGLGLTISRELARRMQGDLQLVPSDRGATFVLTLPCPT